MSTRVQSEEERKLREEYPGMFGHPEAAENEIHLRSIVIDAAMPQVHIYRTQAGMPSARLGEKFLGKLPGSEGNFHFYPIFADVNEFLAAVAADKKEKAEAKK